MYVNCRSWPEGAIITDALRPPPIAQEIDIHVVDLLTLKQVGRFCGSHKAFTPNDDCFFIFLDVSNEYVARYESRQVLVTEMLCKLIYLY